MTLSWNTASVCFKCIYGKVHNFLLFSKFSVCLQKVPPFGCILCWVLESCVHWFCWFSCSQSVQCCQYSRVFKCSPLDLGNKDLSGVLLCVEKYPYLCLITLPLFYNRQWPKSLSNQQNRLWYINMITSTSNVMKKISWHLHKNISNILARKILVSDACL